MKRKLMAIMAAVAAGVALTASARTMTMSVNQTNGEVSSFDFAFEDVGAATTNSLYMAFGTADGGATDLSGWTTVDFVAKVPGDTTALAGVLPPAGWEKGVTHLRFFLLDEPDLKGAQRVEYIESTGTQYIMTGFTPTGKTHVEADIQFTELTTAGSGVFCARGATAKQGDFSLQGFPNQNIWQYEYNTDQRWPQQKPGISRHAIGFDCNGLVVDGTLLGNGSGGTTSYKEFTAKGTMSLFAFHNAGANWDRLSKMKLYSFKAWADLDDTAAAPVLDLLPCTTNGVACLYDLASGTFLGNIGTGEFVAGPDVAGITGEIEAVSELVNASWRTLGLWTFDGESGVTVVGDRTTTVTFSNHVARTDAMRLDLVWPDNTAADTPLPTYTNDVQYAYLFDGVACTNLVQACGSSIQIRHKDWNSATASADASYNRPHAFLKLEDVGALIKDSDWTLEVIARLDDRSTGSGWCPMLILGTNTGNRACFTWRTSAGTKLINAYATSASSPVNTAHSYSYPRYDTMLGNPADTTVRPCDGNWHHIAWKWSESARTLTYYVDYGLAASADYWNSNGVNLELDDHAAFSLFPSSSSSCNHLPTIQAVRLTRGDRPVRDFLCTSRFPSLPETVGHWRYEGTPGENNCFFVKETSMPNRTDLRLWKQFQSRPLPYVAPWKPYVRQGSDRIQNQSGVCGSTNETVMSTDVQVRIRRCYMNCMQENPWWTLPGANGSFTYEAFLRLARKTIRAGEEYDYKAVVFAEKDGPGGMKDSAASDRWRALNWGLCQDNAAADAPGAKMTLETWEAPDGDEAGNGRKRSDVSFYVSTNDWHHVAVTYDAPAKTLKIYVNHQLAKDVNGNDISVTMSEGYHLTRGASMVSPGENNALYWNGGIIGSLDEFRVTRRALAPAEFLRESAGLGIVLVVR